MADSCLSCWLNSLKNDNPIRLISIEINSPLWIIFLAVCNTNKLADVASLKLKCTKCASVILMDVGCK